eukprot:scaffold1313_cov250-Pinguiococcus_pyrenoidosus.AAC.16
MTTYAFGDARQTERSSSRDPVVEWFLSAVCGHCSRTTGELAAKTCRTVLSTFDWIRQQPQDLNGQW